MIKINKFSSKVKEDYLDKYRSRFPVKISWYPACSRCGHKYEIDREILLTGEREDVLHAPDMELYIELRKIIIKKDDPGYCERALNKLISKHGLTCIFCDYSGYISGYTVIPQYVML